MILVLIDIPHRSEFINFIFSVLRLSNSVMASVEIVGITGIDSVTVGVSVASGIMVVGVSGVVVGVYLGEGGRTISLTILGGCGSIELGRSNSMENDGGQFFSDFGSSKCV